MPNLIAMTLDEGCGDIKYEMTTGYAQHDIDAVLRQLRKYILKIEEDNKIIMVTVKCSDRDPPEWVGEKETIDLTKGTA